MRAARALAESQGWDAVTVRRLAVELGVSQPVLYSAFDNRQAIVDAVALDGFSELAAALGAAAAAPKARMGVYLEFAAAHPELYTAMFSMPSGLAFASDDVPAPLARAFAALGDAFPDADDTWLEVAWSMLHGVATLQAGGRLTPGQEQARLDLVHHLLSRPPSGPQDQPVPGPTPSHRSVTS